MRLRPLLLPLLALSPLASGCGSRLGSIFDEPDACVEAEASSSAQEEPEPGGIRAFESEAELDGYLGAIAARNKAAADAASRCRRSAKGDAEGAPAAFGASAGPSSDSANESVTNNQEAGVDEGGIVKNIGDSLVVLRKGRLFVVNVAPGAAPALSDSMRVARTESLNDSVWYDEMLVKGDLVYVVGYRYGVAAPGDQVRGATEIDTFRVTGGKLERLKSLFLESNDYYSGNNYASRMVDGKLVFYMPHYAGEHDGKRAYPRVLEGRDDGTFAVVGPIFTARDVSTSLVRSSSPTFHTVIQCELPASGDLSCRGKSVLGGWWREHYVAPGAVYLWSDQHVYRFDFASLDVTAHKVQGHPVDQFSFRQGDSDLFVATNPSWDYAGGQAKEVDASVLSLPLAAFDKTGAQPVVPARSLGKDKVIMRNRFVGDVLVAALDEVKATGDEGAGHEVIALDPKRGTVSRRRARHGVTRLEPLGEGRVLVVGGDGSDGITLDSLAVGDMTRTLGRVALAGVQEGEGRSHGFFYKPGAAGAGMFGYAVIAPPQPGAVSGWGNGISNLGFFDVASTGAVAARGIVSAGTDESQCETSCVDWYGNTRPVFLGGRVFALMGSELAEVSLADGGAAKGAAAELAWDSAEQ